MSYLQDGTCALCGRAGEYLCDSEWGRIHEDCGYRKAAEEQRARDEADAVAAILDSPPEPPPALVALLADAKSVQCEEQRARGEALREEGRQQERAAIVARLRGEAEANTHMLLDHPEDRDIIEPMLALLHRLAEAFERGVHTQKGDT